MSKGNRLTGLIESDVWKLPDPYRLVWITMLCLCDEEGVFVCDSRVLAGLARVTHQECYGALAVLPLEVLHPNGWRLIRNRK